MILNYGIIIFLCMFTRVLGKYHHERKHMDHKHQIKVDLDNVRHHGSHKDAHLKELHGRKPHNSHHINHKDHAKSSPLTKARRSIESFESTFRQQLQEDGREYAITTDYPSYRRYYRDLGNYYINDKIIQDDNESQIKRTERIRTDLMKYFGSYSWRHSFKPEIWDNLYKEVERSMDRMKQLHEEQRIKFFSQFTNAKHNNGGKKTKIEEVGFSLNNKERGDEKEYFSTTKNHYFDSTTSNPVDDDSDSLTDSNGSKKLHRERKNQKHHHHHHSAVKMNLNDRNFDFNSNINHKKHHNHRCHHYPSLGHYGHHSRPNYGISFNTCPYEVKVPQSTTSKYLSSFPKISPKPYNYVDVTATDRYSIQTDKIQSKNDTGIKPIEEISDEKEDQKNHSSTYSVYETPKEEVSHFPTPIETHVHIPTVNSSASHIQINHDTHSNNSSNMDSGIHFPTNDTKPENQGHADPCKNGGTVQIPLLNIDLPCGNVGSNESHPEDYYKREFATSMSSVFQDYLEKEKEADKEKSLDLDIRVGRKRRSPKGTYKKIKSMEIVNSSSNKSSNSSVFGEIMDVPKDLSKNDSNEYFDLTMLSDYFLEAVDSLDETSLIDVLVALREDYLSKSPNDQAVVDEVYDKLTASLLEYKRSNGDMNVRRRRENPPKARAEAVAALELLAETEQHLESEQQDDPSVNEDYGEYIDPEREIDSSEDPSFLELVSLADKHKLKAR